MAFFSLHPVAFIHLKDMIRGSVSLHRIFAGPQLTIYFIHEAKNATQCLMQGSKKQVKFSDTYDFWMLSFVPLKPWSGASDEPSMILALNSTRKFGRSVRKTPMNLKLHRRFCLWQKNTYIHTKNTIQVWLAFFGKFHKAIVGGHKNVPSS